MDVIFQTGGYFPHLDTITIQTEPKPQLKITAPRESPNVLKEGHFNENSTERAPRVTSQKINERHSLIFRQTPSQTLSKVKLQSEVMLFGE